jgi:hypothetical protein
MDVTTYAAQVLAAQRAAELMRRLAIASGQADRATGGIDSRVRAPRPARGRLIRRHATVRPAL